MKQTVCLNMIVRNESRVIERCLSSVRKFIDHWVIVDTGSNDGTQPIIQRCLRDVPGALIERPWIDFAHNRSEALELARGKSDYVFVIDADEELVTTADYSRPQLTHDAYYLKIYSGPDAFWRIQLFRNAPGWRYESAVHEYLVVPETATDDRLRDAWINSHTDGARAAEPGVYQRDIELLLRDYEKDRKNSRTVFYLAQSYTATRQPELALQYYERCVEVSGWPEEAWLAMFQIAETKLQLQRDWSEVLQAYLAAYQYRPTRAEPLYRIAVHYRWQSNFHLAHLFLQQAAAIPYPQQDFLFVEDRLYRYLIKMALATCSYHTGDYATGIRICDELLEDRRHIPANIYDQLLVNRQQCRTKAAQGYASSTEQWPKMKVFVVFRNPGPHFDNCIERLLRQTCVPFEVVFVDEGSTDGSAQKVPIEDPRITLASCSEDQPLASFVAEQCDESDVVLLLDGRHWLSSEETLAQLQQYFVNPGCLVTYGPATYPLGFRASLLQQIDPAGDIAIFAEEHEALAQKLLTAAGSEKIRFNMEPICVADANGTPPPYWKPEIFRNSPPMISCLTVTLNRLVLLKEAINCFCKQTYPNRELVIVTDGTPRYLQAIDDYIRWLGRSDIRVVYVNEPGQTLGALRNISLDAARGAVVCQWDDDDLNHPERLERQFNHMKAAHADACCFTDQLQFFFQARALYWSDWRTGDTQGVEQLIPGTLMTYRDTHFRYPETDQFASAGEDSVLLEQIAASRTVTPFQDAGYLNVYSYHGRNVFPELHHRRIAVQSGRSFDFMRQQEPVLRAALRHYRLPEPYRVTTGEGVVMFVTGQRAQSKSLC
jgi:glycosyltransferase involved in cell wall biosynthesis